MLKIAVGAAGAIAVSLLWYGIACAQQVPNAGSVLRQQPAPPTPPPVPAPALPSAPKKAAPAEVAGPHIKVRGFRIVGATLFPPSKLKALLAPMVGRELTLGEIRAGAEAIVGYYAKRGYLARVLLLPQTMHEGIVTLTVIEGRLGSVKIEGRAVRIDRARLRRFVLRGEKSGGILDLAKLGEALTIANEQPGVSARATLVPGTRKGAVNVAVIAADTPLTSSSLTLDNDGSRATGQAQASAAFTLANPTGLFDSASLLANTSNGTNYLSGDYSLALGDHGWRGGLNASYLDYRVVAPAFSALHAHGDAATVGLTLTDPLARRHTFGLTFTGTLDATKLRDFTVAGETSNRVVSVASLGLSGYHAEGGGMNTFEVKVSTGKSDERNAGALVTDQAGRRVQGWFQKVSYALGRVQPLGEVWTLNLKLRGQFTDRNLDSSERFQTGGPNGVRAYPVGEAPADEAALFTAGLRRNLGARVSGGVFVDAARVRLSRYTYAGAATPNEYNLWDVGTSVDWQVGRHALLSLAVAGSPAKNPGRDALGNNADGLSRRLYVWVNLTAQL